VGAALGSCMATLMGIFAQRHSIPLEGAKIEVAKTMVQQPIRRIGEFKVDIYLPVAADHSQRAGLERAALTCPVHQSLHPDVKIRVPFTGPPATILSRNSVLDLQIFKVDKDSA